jgi:hypothetical protein
MARKSSARPGKNTRPQAKNSPGVAPRLHALIVAVVGTYATEPNHARLAATIAAQTNVAQAIGAARAGGANHAAT